MHREYISLHDLYLQVHHKHRDNIWRLKKGGYITSGGKASLDVRLIETVPSKQGSPSAERARAEKQLPSCWVEAVLGKVVCVAGLIVLE